MTRLTLIRYDAAHLYQLAYEHFQVQCPDCKDLKRRLRKFIGAASADDIRRTVKRSSYCSQVGKILKQKDPCKESWESKPYRSKHVWTSHDAFHPMNLVDCVKCGKPYSEWEDEMARRATTTL